MKTQFYEFGKHMRTVAIATVLTLIPPISPIAGLIALIFIFLALGDIKHLNYQLNDPNLELFRKKYISGFVDAIIGIVLLVAGGVVLAINLLIPPFVNVFFVVGLPVTIVLMAAGLILLIVSYAVEMKAWENLKIYFQANKSLFPEHVRHELIDGCDNLRTGALLMALGFLGITILIGWIFQAVGYFKLAKLDTLMYFDTSEPQAKETVTQVQKVQEVQPITQQAELDTMEIGNFCPNCGAKVNREGKFCPLCGSQIN